MATLTKAKMAMHNPSHPGEILSEIYLAPMKVSISAAAKALGVSRKLVAAIVTGRCAVSADTAMRIASVFATEAALWINLQAQHDLWVVTQKSPPRTKPLRVAA